MKRESYRIVPYLMPRLSEKHFEHLFVTVTMLWVSLYHSLIRWQYFPFIPRFNYVMKSVDYLSRERPFSISKKQRYGVSPSKLCFRIVPCVEKIASVQHSPL